MTETTINLQNITLSFNFKSAGIERKYQLSELPEASIIALLQYGTRKGNDYVNSTFAEEGNTKTRAQIVEDWLGKLLSGDFTAKRESDDGFKPYLKTVLKKLGYADKALKGLSADELIALVALKKGVDPEKAETALRGNFEKIKALANLDLDI